MTRRFTALSFALSGLAIAGCGADEPQAVASAPPAASASPSAAMADASNATKKPDYPATEKRPTFTMYGSTKVEDDYAWLEAAGAPEVQAWIDAQANFSRAALDREPSRDALATRFHELLATSAPSFTAIEEAKGTVFALKSEPPKQQSFLVVLPSLDDPSSARPLVDPNVRDASGKTTIDWYVPSHDGKRVAVSLSVGGTEDGDVHFFDVASGKELADVLPHVNGGTAGGSLAWSRDDKTVYFTAYRYPPHQGADHLQQMVFTHVLGAPNGGSDPYVIGEDFPAIGETTLQTVASSPAVLVRVAYGDGGDFVHYLASDGKTFRKIADVADHVSRAELGEDGFLYIIAQNDADRGQALRLRVVGGTLANAETLLPEEADASMIDLVPTKAVLYVSESKGGPQTVRAIDLQKKAGSHASTLLPVPALSSARGMTRLGKNDILLNVESYTAPPTWLHWQADSHTFAETKLKVQSPADFSPFEATRGTCTSKDGTKVPLTILAKRGLPHDGTSAALLYGYGGYDISLSPIFTPKILPWLEHGGVWAVANIRGGGELGEGWHRGGMLTQKQNVFDDFYACAVELEHQGFTRPDRLAIHGRSNGGLLMGAELTQHPEAFRAVVAQVGVLDMLKSETTANGAFNVTEYGTVKNPEQFAALYKYSPYHHVVDGTAYPATLLTTGANDPRVNPYNSRKMAARLQAATSSAHPILLRISKDSGHGAGTPLDALIKEYVDVYSFLFGELGMQ